MRPQETLVEKSRVCSPGEMIAMDANFISGHFTFADGLHIISSVAGAPRKFSKLCTVNALNSRYQPAVGDTVVGRVVKLQDNSWELELNGPRHATLRVGSTPHPDGSQRRKLRSDELEMRSFIEEGDLLAPEVLNVGKDGRIDLHSRTLEQFKLKYGHLLHCRPSQIPRLGSQFYTIPCGVDMILGMNGYISHLCRSLITELEEPDRCGVNTIFRTSLCSD